MIHIISLIDRAELHFQEKRENWPRKKNVFSFFSVSTKRSYMKETVSKKTK